MNRGKVQINTQDPRKTDPDIDDQEDGKLSTRRTDREWTMKGPNRISAL